MKPVDLWRSEEMQLVQVRSSCDACTEAALTQTRAVLASNESCVWSSTAI